MASALLSRLLAISTGRWTLHFHFVFLIHICNIPILDILWLTPHSIHDVAPVTNGGSDEIEVADPGNTSREARRLKQEVLFKKWAGLWKTLILSSLDKTFFPYSRYIRTLNLQDLGELLQESKFRDLVSK